MDTTPSTERPVYYSKNPNIVGIINHAGAHFEVTWPMDAFGFHHPHLFQIHYLADPQAEPETMTVSTAAETPDLTEGQDVLALAQHLILNDAFVRADIVVSINAEEITLNLTTESTPQESK